MKGLSGLQRFYKRMFDLFLSALGLLMCWWIIVLAWVIATIDTRSNGLFVQRRIGLHGKSFPVLKIRTMRAMQQPYSHVTTAQDPRITSIGRFWRRTKIDELPQLINVFVGQMSLVGPRPDVPGYADLLSDEDRIILSVRPGITGPATLHFRNEEVLLGSVSDPERYNREEIYPVKVKINKQYIANWSMVGDVRYILDTILGR